MFVDMQHMKRQSFEEHSKFAWVQSLEFRHQLVHCNSTIVEHFHTFADDDLADIVLGFGHGHKLGVTVDGNGDRHDRGVSGRWIW